jgi:hypothetical protein
VLFERETLIAKSGFSFVIDPDLWIVDGQFNADKNKRFWQPGTYCTPFCGIWLAGWGGLIKCLATHWQLESELIRAIQNV